MFNINEVVESTDTNKFKSIEAIRVTQLAAVLIAETGSGKNLFKYRNGDWEPQSIISDSDYVAQEDGITALRSLKKYLRLNNPQVREVLLNLDEKLLVLESEEGRGTLIHYNNSNGEWK